MEKLSRIADYGVGNQNEDVQNTNPSATSAPSLLFRSCIASRNYKLQYAELVYCPVTYEAMIVNYELADIKQETAGTYFFSICL
jgi:hypothetical protein